MMSLRASTKNVKALKFIHDNAANEQKAVSAMRDRVRKRLPVDKDFADSYAGQIASGLGQLTNLPIYVGASAVGGAAAAGTAGAVMTVGQLWQEGKDEYKATMKKQGKPYNEAEADQAAMQYVAVAAPLEVIADYTIIGKFLKSKVAKKLTIGEVIKEGTKTFISEGSTEGMQQAWSNYVAKVETGYDPKRPYTQGVLDSFVVGGFVGGIAGAGGTIVQPTEPAGVAAGPRSNVVIGPVSPEGSMTGAAAQMGKGEAPFTPQVARAAARLTPTGTEEAAKVSAPDIQAKQARVAEIDKQIDKEFDPEKKATLLNEAIQLSAEIDEAQKAAPPSKETEAPSKEAKLPSEPAAKTAPIEPTEEVKQTKSNTIRDKQGRKAEVVKEEKGGKLTVEWEDGTQSHVNESEVKRRKTEETVYKNSVQLVPLGEEGVSVYHYDSNGKKTSKDFDSENEAAQHAVKVANDNNLSGYKNTSDKFVRLAGTPVETTTTTEPVVAAEEPAVKEPAEQPVSPQPGVVAPPGTVATTAPVTAEPVAAAKKPIGLIQRGKNRAKQLLLKNADKVTKRKINSKRYDLESISNTEAESRLMNMVIDGKPVSQHLDDYGFNHLAPVELWHPAKGSGDATVGIRFDFGTKTAAFEINVRDFISELESIGDPAARSQYFHDMVSEEQVHAADHVRMVNDYNKLSPNAKAQYEDKATRRGSNGGFDAFVQDSYAAIAKRLKAKSRGLSKDQQRNMAQVLVDAINTYKVSQEISPTKSDIEDAGGYVGNPEGVYDWLAKDAMGKDAALMAEVVRMAKQHEMQGRISEDTLAQIYHPVQKWFRDRITSINNMLDDVFGGRETPEAQAIYDVFKPELNQIQKVLNEVAAKVSKVPYIEALPEGSKELAAFIGNTQLTKDENGVHQPQHHLSFRDTRRSSNGLGNHVGTAMAAATNNGSTNTPVHVRIENPAMMPDMDWNDPAAVANELRNRGHITSSAYALIAQNGATHTLIRQAMQAKGFDGIAYVNDKEGLRKLMPKEAEAWINEADITHPNQPNMPNTIILHNGKVIGQGETAQRAINDAKSRLTSMPHAIDYSYILFDKNQIKSARGNKVKGKATGGNQRTKKAEEKSLEARIVEMHNQTGGSSINPAYDDVTELDAYSVEVYPEITMIIPGPVLVEQDIIDLQNKMREEGIELDTPDLSIGTWVNAKTGNSEIGVSALIGDLRAAVELGQQFGQEAIWYHGGIGSLIFIQGVQPGVLNLPSLGERHGFVAGKKITGQVSSVFPVFKPRISDPYSFNIGNLPPGKIESVPILSDAEIIASAKRGKDWKDWYTTFDNYMRWLTAKNPEYRPLYAWWFAATSPHNLVGANITASMKAFRNFVVTGDPAIPGPGMKGFMKTHWPNLRRATGLPSQAVKEPTAVGGGIIGGGIGLTGGKVPEFAPALLNDPYAIAVDMHVASVLFGTENPPNGRGSRDRWQSCGYLSGWDGTLQRFKQPCSRTI